MRSDASFVGTLLDLAMRPIMKISIASLEDQESNQGLVDPVLGRIRDYSPSGILYETVGCK